MEAKAQDPRDLVFAVTDNDIDLNLTILEQQTIALDTHAVTFRVIGESHWITVRGRAGGVLQELLSCAPSIMPAGWELHRFTELHPYECELPGFRATVSIGNHLPDVFRRHSADSSLRVEFPTPPLSTFTPATTLVWEVSDSTIQWWTAHEYPEPDGMLVVVSRSVFDVHHHAGQASRSSAVVGVS